MSHKAFLCLCLDVTVDDISRAVDEGFDHPETITRFTGALMGPCQGRWCADLMLAAIAQRTGVEVSSLHRPATRPLAGAVRLGLLAAEDDEA